MGFALDASTAAHLARVAAAWSGLRVAVSSRPDLASHPALSSPLSGTYPDPADVGGWQGWIEPAGGVADWIAFVARDGAGLLWTERDPATGAVIGEPVSFERPDLIAAPPLAVMPSRAQRATLATRARRAGRVDLPPLGGPAPKRVHVWGPGNNPGDYGDNYFTAAAAASLLAEFDRRGNAGLIDIEHGTNPDAAPNLDPTRPPVTGGYWVPEVEQGPDGPHLWVSVRWSNCGASQAQPGAVCCATHQIESGQRCYISPDWDRDATTFEVVRLNKISLVGEPGTYAIPLLASRALAAAAVPTDPTTPLKGPRPMDDLEMLKAVRIGLQQLIDGGGADALKQLAAQLATELDAAASALGIDLTGVPAEQGPPSVRDLAPAGDAPLAAGDAAPTDDPMKKDAPMATAAASDDATTTEEAKRAAAVQLAARGLIAKLTAAAAQAPRPAAPAPAALTAADVERQIAAASNAEREKTRLIASAQGRPGMGPDLAAALAAQPLAAVRAVIAALPPAPVVETVTAGAARTATGATRTASVTDAEQVTAAQRLARLELPKKPTTLDEQAVMSMAAQLALKDLPSIAAKFAAGKLGIVNPEAASKRAWARELATYGRTAPALSA